VVGAGADEPARWNENLHYHPVLLRALPADCELVVDLGCGEGVLTRQIARARPGAHVVGVDHDAASIERARATTPADLDVEYVEADFLTHPLPAGRFDAVLSVAAAHHVGTETALRRCAELVRPGGVVAVEGFARRRLPWAVPLASVSLLLSRALRLVKPYWEHSAPMVWPPDVDTRSMRALARRVLPGADYRFHLLGRWTLVWARPPEHEDRR
jgi:SAM-dependent methyltransferase